MAPGAVLGGTINDRDGDVQMLNLNGTGRQSAMAAQQSFRSTGSRQRPKEF